jgi:cytochrome P450
VFSGPKPLFLIYSSQACEEFLKLIPTKIDRFANHLKHFGRITKGAVDQIPSNSNWKQRRDRIMKIMGVNFSSKYLPLMIQALENKSKNWVIGQYIDFTSEMTFITFDIITQILFGKDIKDKIGDLNYINYQDQVSN